jgi:hypothetical protein
LTQNRHPTASASTDHYFIGTTRDSWWVILLCNARLHAEWGSLVIRLKLEFSVTRCTRMWE